MKFLTLQEKEYGVDIPQNQQHNSLNDTLMAAMDSIGLKNESTAEEGSVVSNLPLLFANGYPTSLEKITLAQLERFVTFMIQCSMGYESTDAVAEPEWWPKEVKFSNPLIRPKRSADNWMANLKKLVFRCYTYHRSEYLLRFCSYLARYPHEDLQYINNWDSTTSLYHKNTGKLLVTFRNENMNYDKNESPRKKLLTSNGVASSFFIKTKQQQQHSNVIVEPSIEDIFLCENCDAEFIGLKEVKEHERVCCKKKCNASTVRPATPDSLVTTSQWTQDQFLEYFRLCSVNGKSKSIEPINQVTDNSEVKRISRRVRGSITFTRCPTIPFSSPAGILLAKKSKIMTKETQQERLDRIERHLEAPLLNSLCKPKWLEAEVDHDKWVVTYKPNREKTTNEYVHQYKFVNSIVKKPMLSIRSQLLYVVCRPAHVLLTRLPEAEINYMKECPWKFRCYLRKSLVNNKTSIVRSQEKVRRNVCSKRKAPADESVLTVALQSEEDIDCKSTLDVAKTCNENAATVKSMENAILCTKPASMIPVIDLCSSDDEQEPRVPASSDENRDPLKPITEDAAKPPLLQKLSLTKFHLTPCICATDQTNDRLSDAALNNNAENCTRKYYDTMLTACANLSPVLTPAP